MNKEQKLKVLRDGFSTEMVTERVEMAGKWMMLQAQHQSDYSNLTLPADVDYRHCLYHEVISTGELVSKYKPGDWVVVIKNALDGLTSNHEFVVCREIDAVLKIK